MGEFESAAVDSGEDANADVDQTVSARLIVPFVRELTNNYQMTPELERLASMDPDDRISLDEVDRVVRPVIEQTRDFAVGLKAGRSLRREGAGALYYAMSSAPTLAAALTLAGRYFRLLNDTVEMKVQRGHTHAFVSFHSTRPFTPITADFLLAAMYYGHFRTQLSDLSQMEVWLAHERPPYVDEYAQTFSPAPILYGVECYGFRFPIAELDAPLQGSDSDLHHVLRQHIEHVLSQMTPKHQHFADKVSALITKDLARGATVTAVAVAQRFHMSPRTLARRLESEGTTFSELLDGLRRRLAAEYMASTVMSQSEVAFLLGFSHVAAFHRAFKRWTGLTPRAYRVQVAAVPASDRSTDDPQP